MAAPMVVKFCCTKALSPSRLYCSTANVLPKTANIVKADKEPIRKRIVGHLKRIVEDYKNAITDTKDYVREKPMRTTFYGLLTAATSYLYTHNPSMDDYEGHLAVLTSDLAEVGVALRNKEKCRQVQTILDYHSHGRLRRFSFGVFSLIWVSEHPKYIDLYEAQCKDIQMTWSEWPRYIVDIGVLGQWRYTQQYMVDFDINPDEWTDTQSNASSNPPSKPNKT